MFEFLVTVAAIIVAQFVVIGFIFGICMNQRFVKWYTKKCLTVTKEVQEEMVDMFDKIEL